MRIEHKTERKHFYYFLLQRRIFSNKKFFLLGVYRMRLRNWHSKCVGNQVNGNQHDNSYCRPNFHFQIIFTGFFPQNKYYPSAKNELHFSSSISIKTKFVLFANVEIKYGNKNTFKSVYKKTTTTTQNINHFKLTERTDEKKQYCIYLELSTNVRSDGYSWIGVFAVLVTRYIRAPRRIHYTAQLFMVWKYIFAIFRTAFTRVYFCVAQ